ncbi:MAG: TSUP family transporter [Candidatus Latescibacterota bacterium]
MVIGSVFGALLLRLFPADRLDLLVAAVVLALGVWFLAGRGEAGGCTLCESLPDRVSGGDLLFSAFAGVCGGLFAVSGPPIVYWLGRKYAKHAFRRTLIVLFFFANSARLLTYGATGLLTGRMALLSLAAIPGVLLGIFLGNRIFFALSERWFSRVIGVMLVIIALRMMMK